MKIQGLFEPEPGETIELFGATFSFQGVRIGHVDMVDAIDIGTRGTLYRLHDSDERSWALKVFRPGFQEPVLARVCRRLEPLRGLQGFVAAGRRMVPPDAPLANAHPQLRYAMLMPWVAGRTWSSLLAEAGRGSVLREWAAIHLCARFLGAVRALESLGAAHTDLAAGNVVIDLETLEVQLIDLEDLFFPGEPRSRHDNVGVPGYRHPVDPDFVGPEGDRYAAAILAAEILLLSRPMIAARAEESGLFGPDHTSREASTRFRQAETSLQRLAPGFLEVFRASWHSTSPRSCPTVSDLEAPVAERAADVAHGASPVLVPHPIRGLSQLAIPRLSAPAPEPDAPPRSRIRSYRSLLDADRTYQPPSEKEPNTPPIPPSERPVPDSRAFRFGLPVWLAMLGLLLLLAISIAEWQ